VNPLIVTVSEPDTGATWDYVFEAGPVVVGRGEGVQLCLDRPFVSLQHGTFYFDDGQVTYVDLDSRNGTLIDGAARASDRPVPVTEGTDLRIGKLRLQVSRVAPSKRVGEEKKDPFAPRPGPAAAKGTDALPREDLERIRREMVARKEPPVMVPAAAVVPMAAVVPSVVPAAPAAAPPSAPLLEKTVPVPALTSRPLPEVGAMERPSSTYAIGEPKGVPLPARASRVRRTPRSTRPREVSSRPPVAEAQTRRGPWLPIAVGIVVASAAALLLLTLGGGERRPSVEPEPPETVTGRASPTVTRPAGEPVAPTGAAGEPVAPTGAALEPVAPRGVVVDPPRRLPPPARPKHVVTPRPAPRPAAPEDAPTGSRSPILP
jgi:pSer/pThr/pTyr-binding forkhead associated (FHA) protein